MKMRQIILILLSFCMIASASAAVNIAPLGTATQSSTGFGGTADRAIDGNQNGIFGAGSVTHTNLEANAWWQVTLPAVSLIDQIIIFNRTDCCDTRINPFNLYILNGSTTVQSFLGQTFLPDITGANVSGMTFDTSALGNIVKVELAATNNLSLAEVEVYPFAAAIPEPSTYALMLAGLGAIVVAARRRARKPASASA